jgi:adenylate kinase family enzyme
MRVAILGNSGSGKSTLAQKLAGSSGTPRLDLDTVAWEPGKIAVARDPAAAADVRAFCEKHASWIVEGCYANLISASLPFGPQLLFLDPGPEQCQSNCRARPWESHKYTSPDEQDARLEFLLHWVADYYSRDGDMSWQEHKRLFDDYPGPKLHLRSDDDQLLQT